VLKILECLTVLWCIYLFGVAWNAYKTEKIIDNIKDTPWVVVVTTWAIATWDLIKIPEDIREYMDYIMENGEAWVDFFVATPTNQPNMNSSDWNKNTENMHKYLYSNRISFDVNQSDKQWYIMFMTSKKISNNRNLFMWINWKTVWRINLDKKIEWTEDNEYMFKYDKLPIIWNNYSWDEDLNWKWINAVVWEAYNKVEKIIIFFK